MNWIDQYMEYTKEHEAVAWYHEWCALSCLASAVGRKCWTQLGYSYIYPNLFVILVGPAALPRKTEALRVAISFLNALEDEGYIHTSSESVTMAKLCDDLRMAEDSVDINGEKYSFCALTTLTDELGSFIKRGDAELIRLLIKLYNCEPRHRHGTRQSGTVLLRNTCLNLLAATTPSLFKGVEFEEQVQTGFTSRCIFLFAETRRFNNSFPIVDEGLQKRLIDALFRLAEITGEIPLNKEAQEFFDTWYNNLPLIPDTIPALKPYYGRKQTHIRKVAMIYTLLDMLEGGNQITSQSHIERAIQTLDQAEEHMQDAFVGMGRSPELADMEDIIATIQLSGRWVSKTEIMMKHKSDIPPKLVLEILNNLYTELRCIDKRHSGENIWYKWKGMKKNGNN